MTAEPDPRDQTTDETDETDQSQDPTRRPGELTEEELADEMSEESFPGSDPPSTWAGPAR